MSLWIRVALVLGLCAVFRGQAFAQSDEPDVGGAAAGTGGGDMPMSFNGLRIRGLAIMPVNGVLQIENVNGEQPTVTMTDEAGAVISGSSRFVMSLPSGSALFVWKADLELTPGTHMVALSDVYSTEPSLDTIEVVPAFPDGLPPISSEPSTSLIIANSSSDCCNSPFDNPGLEACFTTQQEIVASVQAGITSSAGAAWTNQYFFRLNPVDAELRAPLLPLSWTPFELVGAMSFRVQRDEYCFVIEAQNLVTQQTEGYEDPVCAPGAERELGTFDVEVENGALAPQVCLLPPEPYEERWCMLNDHACDAGPSDACEHYDYVCKDGSWPSSWDDLSNSSIDPGFTAPSSRKGCTTVPSTRSSSPPFVCFLLLASLWAARIRARRLASRPPSKPIATFGSCGCTRGAVVRLDADDTKYMALLAKLDGLADVPACAPRLGSLR